jgi:hypothetical protein
VSYTVFDSSKPASTQTGPQFAGSANANDCALEDMVGIALMQGFTFSQSGGSAEEPTTLLFTNGARILKLALTWSGGYVSTMTPSLSTNSGVSYDTIGSAATLTYDGSGNLTASSSGSLGGFVLKLIEWIGKTKALRTTVNSNSSTIAALQSMAFQAANAVAIIGGSVACTYERETVQALSNGNAANTLNWAAGGMATLTVTGASCTIAHSNLPSGVVGYQTVKLVNAGLASALFSGLKWPSGTPVAFTASGTDLLTLMCHDGSNVYVVGISKGLA